MADGESMMESTACSKADHWISLLITHQPALFGNAHGLNDPTDVAEKLTTLRKELIERLTKQPG